MITVTNKRDNPTGEYIGRPSPLGNPFIIGEHGKRKEVILHYHIWLTELWNNEHHHPALTELHRLAKIERDEGNLNLICWCAPQACHGDIIKDFIGFINTTGDKS